MKKGFSHLFAFQLYFFFILTGKVLEVFLLVGYSTELCLYMSPISQMKSQTACEALTSWLKYTALNIWNLQLNFQWERQKLVVPEWEDWVPED